MLAARAAASRHAIARWTPVLRRCKSTMSPVERPPPVRKIDSGVQPKLGINSVTGKVELALGRQPSYATSAVRRQLSALFADDDDDEFADMRSGLDAIDMAGWQHNHFGAPLAAESAL